MTCANSGWTAECFGYFGCPCPLLSTEGKDWIHLAISLLPCSPHIHTSPFELLVQTTLVIKKNPATDASHLKARRNYFVFGRSWRDDETIFSLDVSELWRGDETILYLDDPEGMTRRSILLAILKELRFDIGILRSWSGDETTCNPDILQGLRDHLRFWLFWIKVGNTLCVLTILKGSKTKLFCLWTDLTEFLSQFPLEDVDMKYEVR